MSYKFRNLVFEGGGVKGIAYGGALVELKKRGLLDHVKRAAGTSAGAITAALLALGYTPEEVSRIIAETNFSSFADDDFGFARDTKRLLDEYGWHKGNKFKIWLGKLVREKTGSSKTTFGDLLDLAESREEFKQLYVVGTNLTSQETEIYSHERFPDMEIREAVRISMSIPLYFRCVRNKEDEVLVDGGVTRNYPLDLFDHERYIEDEQNAEVVDYNQTPGFRFNHETLGLRLDERGEKIASMVTGQAIPQDIDNIFAYANALVTFMRNMAFRLHLHGNDWKRTVTIDTTGVGVTEFDISPRKIQLMIDNGILGVATHLDWREGKTEEPGLELPF